MSARRGELLLFSSAAAVLAVGAVGYFVLFDRPGAAPQPATTRPPTELPASPPGRVDPSFAVRSSEGLVEIRHGDGPWTVASVGERLGARDAIRTGAGGRAVLASAIGDELELRPRVELAVAVLGDTVAELRLNRGGVTAAPAESRERLTISAGGAAAVGAGGGRFTVYSDERGAVAVASHTGDVRVVAGGREVTLGTGTQTYVPAGGVPRDPAPIPDGVLLSVAWPDGVSKDARVTLRGQAAPGSAVEVNGAPVAVGDDGGFVVRPLLRPGQNPIEVVVEALDGRTRTETGRVEVDRKGPEVSADPSQLFAPSPPPR